MNAAATLRTAVESRPPVVAPGVFNALFAELVERAGFPAVYLSGAGVANSLLGRPDIGLVTMDEMAFVAERICAAVGIPVIADADTGYGGVHNVARTVTVYERAGVAAIQLEDQVFPKRCGHFEGKAVVPVGEMLERLAAARDARSGELLIIARTDAAGPLGLDEAIARARSYGAAGADLLFVEAPRDRDELERVGRELADWPLVANMVEYGKTPLLSARELADLGFSVVLFPGTITRLATRAVGRLLDGLAATGSSEDWLAEMATFDEVNEIVGLSDADAWEQSIADESARRGNSE